MGQAFTVVRDSQVNALQGAINQEALFTQLSKVVEKVTCLEMENKVLRRTLTKAVPVAGEMLKQEVQAVNTEAGFQAITDTVCGLPQLDQTPFRQATQAAHSILADSNLKLIAWRHVPLSEPVLAPPTVPRLTNIYQALPSPVTANGDSSNDSMNIDDDNIRLDTSNSTDQSA